jgi:hypothetical protein
MEVELTRMRVVLLGFLLLCAALLVWWFLQKPSHERPWADDVARLLTAQVDGSVVTLSNVRDFEWRTETDYTARWETRQYDLDTLQSADLVLSYWMGPAIAHTLVSFGFADGRYLTFSSEIRKEKGEAFSAWKGFFRQYEAVMIAAQESDIIRVRSEVRGEQVYMYRLAIPPEQLRTLFLAYVDEARRIEKTPEFYNTLTSNCTTVVFQIAKQIQPDLPLDYRLLLSGYFAEYAHDQGGLVAGVPFEVLKKRGRVQSMTGVQNMANEQDYSRYIRRELPK